MDVLQGVTVKWDAVRRNRRRLWKSTEGLYCIWTPVVGFGVENVETEFLKYIMRCTTPVLGKTERVLCVSVH